MLSVFLVVFGFFPQVMADLYQLYYSFSLFGRGGVRALVLKKRRKISRRNGQTIACSWFLYESFLIREYVQNFKKSVLRFREVWKYLSSLIWFPFGIGVAAQDLQKKEKGEKKSPHLLSENMTGLQRLTAILLQSENKQICQSRQYNMSFYTCFSPFPKLLIISA